MRSLLIATLDRLIGHKPRITPAATVRTIRRSETSNIALVLILYTYGEPVERNASIFSQMEDIFVTVVDVATLLMGL